MQITLGEIHISKNLDRNSFWSNACIIEGSEDSLSRGQGKLVLDICLTMKFPMPCICDRNYCLFHHFKTFAEILYITFFIFKIKTPTFHFCCHCKKLAKKFHAVFIYSSNMRYGKLFFTVFRIACSQSFFILKDFLNKCKPFSFFSRLSKVGKLPFFYAKISIKDQVQF